MMYHIIQETNGHTTPLPAETLGLVSEITRLRARVAQLEAEKASAAARISNLMDQHNEMVAALKFARYMAGLWKRAAKEQWHFKQLVNEYMQSLKADEEG